MGTGTCPICRSTFQRRRMGRPRIYCGQICRQRAHAMRHQPLLDRGGPSLLLMLRERGVRGA